MHNGEVIASIISRDARALAGTTLSSNRDTVRFAWYEPNTPETAFGYRVIGSSFVIEMGSVDPTAQHLHTVYHDLANALERAA